MCVYIYIYIYIYTHIVCRRGWRRGISAWGAASAARLLITTETNITYSSTNCCFVIHIILHISDSCIYLFF